MHEGGCSGTGRHDKDGREKEASEAGEKGQRHSPCQKRVHSLFGHKAEHRDRV